MMIKLKDLMTLERILLEIEDKYKFQIGFSDAYKLHEYLKDVGMVTDYAFSIQDEFFKKYNDIEKLDTYHNKIMEDSIDFEYDEITKFIDKFVEHFDLEFYTLVKELKFW